MVCSRAIPAAPESGRERTLRFIHRALQQGGDVTLLHLSSALERPSVWRLAKTTGRWLAGVISGRPEPLQSLLFWDSSHLRTLRRQVAELQPDTVYFDGVRTGIYLPLIRRTSPGLRLVCDFDDLMSARMANLARDGQPASLGYLGKHLPGWLTRQVIQPLAAGVIPRYEARALARAELQIMACAQAVVLVSSVDAQALRALGGAPSTIQVAPPAMPSPNGAQPADRVERFVFIGADSLLQNRKSIEHLVALWQRLQPDATLHLYGRQKGDYSQVRGVVVHGFVADVAQAYSPGSVLLAPSFVSGGVKTKVLEAMAHGVVVVGTATTFEGIEADTQALVLDDAQLTALVLQPAATIGPLAAAALAAITQVQQRHNIEALGRRWRAVVWPDHAPG
jgi:glycosyltransferase involved in cell wall biosynthesis